MPCNIYRIGAKFCDLALGAEFLDECLHSSMKWSSGTFSPQEDKRFSFGRKQYLNNLAYFVAKLYKSQTAPCHLKTFWKHITESIQCRFFSTLGFRCLILPPCIYVKNLTLKWISEVVLAHF